MVVRRWLDGTTTLVQGGSVVVQEWHGGGPKSFGSGPGVAWYSLGGGMMV